ncbi:DUF4386 domain-containing protein [Arthrobacter sp. NA-172]|uniref:DUF4386 domain-containing protein n=1 Tax=Arthrobacter sp. NA-172 TaxID=3367524 RepID=UPI0037547AC1
MPEHRDVVPWGFSDIRSRQRHRYDHCGLCRPGLPSRPRPWRIAHAHKLGPGGADALVLLLMDLQHSGFLIAQIFFGLWLLPMGYLAFTSGMFPKGLGVLLIIACFTYLAHLPFVFLWPEVGTVLTPFVAIPTTLAEVWMVLYLLIRGVKAPKRKARVSAAV